MISDLHAAQIIGEEKDNERTNNKQNDFNEIIRDGRRIPASREFAGVQKMSFEERFQLLIDHEYDRRKSNTLKRLIKSVNFQDSQACIEDIEYHEDRKLEKMRILELSSCNYVRQTNNIIIKGPTEPAKAISHKLLAYPLAANTIQWSMCAFRNYWMNWW